MAKFLDKSNTKEVVEVKTDSIAPVEKKFDKRGIEEGTAKTVDFVHTDQGYKVVVNGAAVDERYLKLDGLVEKVEDWEAEGYEVTLDGKPVRTPKKK